MPFITVHTSWVTIWKVSRYYEQCKKQFLGMEPFLFHVVKAQTMGEQEFEPTPKEQTNIHCVIG